MKKPRLVGEEEPQEEPRPVEEGLDRAEADTSEFQGEEAGEDRLFLQQPQILPHHTPMPVSLSGSSQG